MKYTNSNQVIRAMETKSEIIRLLKDEIPYKVAHDLIYNFEKEGFFEAPASIKHHNNFTGGLALHCLNVYNNLRRLYKAMYGSVTCIIRRRLILIAFCHDVCKLDDYVFNEERNEWVYVDNFLPGHAKRSLEKLEAWGIELEPEVRTSIQFHMGAFEKKEYTWDELSDANDKCPLSMLTHMADCLEAHNVN